MHTLPHPERLDDVATVRPVTPAIGAEITGLDLAADDLSAAVHLIEAAVGAHHVVFVRGQQLDHGAHTRLAAAFGPLNVPPVDRLTGADKRVSVIADSEDRPPAAFPWHTDLSWLHRPPRLGILHALHIPDVGGDTLWASGVAMMRLLRRCDPELAERVRHLRAIHSVSPSLLRTVATHHGEAVAATLAGAHPPIRHPLVRHHPTTGEPSLFLCPLYVIGIDGLQPDEERRVLDRLHRLIDEPEVQVRWRWRDGDVAIWDESTTVHRALGDHFPRRRAMRRCAVDAVDQAGRQGVVTPGWGPS